MKWTAKNFLLLDGLGALLTAFLLGVMLMNFQAYIGMPTSVLQSLALLVLSFAVFSFASFLLVKQSHHHYLSIIAAANFLYCVLTSFLIAHFWEALTTLGIVYFLTEILVILGLVFMEWRAVKHKK